MLTSPSITYVNVQSRLSLGQNEASSGTIGLSVGVLKPDGDTMHSRFMNTTNLRSELSRIHIEQVKMVHEQRAVRIAKNLRLRQMRLIKKVPRGPPSVFLNKFKYPDVLSQIESLPKLKTIPESIQVSELQ